jgi:dTDP-4-dehydrorhamnose 3,5-epimerase-like enzyme
MSKKESLKYKDPFTVIPLENHPDKRGNLFEILRLSETDVSSEGCLSFSTINQGEMRGDHYHQKKKMWFTCVSGEVVFLLEDAEGNKTKLVINSVQPTAVYCAPRTVRAIYNKKVEPAIIVFFASAENNPENPDIFHHHIDYGTD